jgi:hypothetical protein
MNQLLDGIKDDEQILQMTHGKNIMFTKIKINDILPLIDTKNSNICEILHHFPKKIYFDVDGKDPKECNLTAVKDIINKHFDNPKMSISGSETDTKNSYHIVLNDYIIQNERQLIDLKNLVQYIKENENKYFDDKVYTKNRAMKMINQSKPDREKQLIIEDEVKTNHFINNFINPSSKPYEFKLSYEKESILIDKLPKLTPEKNAKLYKEFKPTDLNESKKLLYMMPIDDNLHHNYCVNLSNFSYWNGLTFEEFWEWNKKKKDSADRRQRYLYYWNNHAKDTKFKINKGYVIKLLSVYYPNINDLKDHITANFIKSFDIDSKNIPVLEVKDKIGNILYETADIKMKHFETPNKVAIFNIGMGGGKTGATVEYLKQSKQSFIWLSPRQALVMNTHQRFVKEKMEIVNYLDCGTSREIKKTKINKAKNLLLECESLNYLENTSKYDVLVIDEIESVLNTWDSETHIKNLNNNFYNFKALFENCKKIILLDAFTTTKTINFLKSLNINDIITYSSDYEKRERKLVENDTYQKTIDKIIKDIDDKKKLFIFYSFKGSSNGHLSIEEFRYELMKRCQGKPSIMVYHADKNDTDKKTLYNVNEEWMKHDVILTTSSITVGVNYEKDDFDKVYLFISGMTNNPRDVIQTSMRIRNPKDSIIELYFHDKEDKHIYEYNDYYKSKLDLVYNGLIDHLVVEKTAKFMPSFFKFCDLTNYKRHHIKVMKKKCPKFVNDTFTSKMLMPYSKIDNLDDIKANEIEKNNVWSYNATMTEKFQIAKYYFNKKFHKLDDDERNFIWNYRLETAYKNLNCDLVKKIEEDNNCDLIDLDFKKIKVSEDTNKYIKENYNDFKYKKEDMMIVKLLKFKGFTIEGFRISDMEFTPEIKELYEIHHKTPLNGFIDDEDLIN